MQIWRREGSPSLHPSCRGGLVAPWQLPAVTGTPGRPRVLAPYPQNPTGSILCLAAWPRCQQPLPGSPGQEPPVLGPQEAPGGRGVNCMAGCLCRGENEKFSHCSSREFRSSHGPNALPITAAERRGGWLFPACPGTGRAAFFLRVEMAFLGRSVTSFCNTSQPEELGRGERKAELYPRWGRAAMSQRGATSQDRSA